MRKKNLVEATFFLWKIKIICLCPHIHAIIFSSTLTIIALYAMRYDSPQQRKKKTEKKVYHFITHDYYYYYCMREYYYFTQEMAQTNCLKYSFRQLLASNTNYLIYANQGHKIRL